LKAHAQPNREQNGENAPAIAQISLPKTFSKTSIFFKNSIRRQSFSGNLKLLFKTVNRYGSTNDDIGVVARLLDSVFERSGYRFA